jgi:hypothetical protein
VPADVLVDCTHGDAVKGYVLIAARSGDEVGSVRPASVSDAGDNLRARMAPVQVAQPLGDRVRLLVSILSWSPVVLGAAYLVLFAARLPRLIERVYWDSDAATAAVIAATMGRGTVVLERFGWFTALWFALLTRSLPMYRQIWEVAPYLLSLCSVALLAWASWRLAGRWAAAMTATAAAATSPFVSYDLVTLNFHTATWLPTVILSGYCLWLAQRPPRGRAVVVAVLVSALAGATLASDLLFAAVGLIPLVLTGVLLLSLRRMRFEGSTVLVSALAAAPLALVTTSAMSLANVDVSKRAATRFAAATDVWPNVGRLLRQIVQLANGDYFLDAQLGTRSALSFACAVVVVAALAAPFALVGRELRSSAPMTPRLVYGAFWATSIVAGSAAFVFSSEGVHGGFYLIPILYATAATAPIALSRSVAGRLVASLGVAVVATTSLVNLADTRTTLLGTLPPVERLAGLPPLASVAHRIVDIAQKERATDGYADYWDASSLTWSTHMAVHVRPVSQCGLPSRALCAYTFNVISSWFDGRAPRSFVLRDAGSIGLHEEPPQTLGPPSATYTIGDGFTMYVYPYDVASRLDYSYAPWHRAG